MFLKKFELNRINTSIFVLLVFTLTLSSLNTIQASEGQFFSSLQESSRRQIILNLLEQVDRQNWYETISELSANEDLEQPGHFFRSRYSLRVHDAKQLNRKPEPDYACDNAAEYIAEKFRSYGLKVEFDPFEHKRLSMNGDIIGIYTMRNVVATLPGKGPNSDKYYLMTAHYDSIASKTDGWKENWRSLPAPGAVDNASGVAGILEAARILSQQDFDFTIKFIAFTGEEIGLFGSKHFAELAEKEDYPILGVLNFDMIGHDEDDILDVHVVGNSYSEWLVNAFRNTQEIYDIQLDFHKVIDAEFIYSDHSPFWERGFSAVMVGEESSFESVEWPNFIHSEEDTIEKLNLDMGERTVKLTVATIAELAVPISVTSVDEINPELAWTSNHLGVPEKVAKNQIVSISAGVENKVDIDVKDVEIKFWAVDSNGKSQNILNQNFDLEAKESYTVTTTFKLDQWGVYTIHGVINPELTVFESDFSNNIIEQKIVVSDEQVALEDVIAYPNPFAPDTTDAELHLVYKMGRDAAVTVSLYSVLGELIWDKEFVIGQKGGQLGRNEVSVWTGHNKYGERIAPGIYFCHVSTHDEYGDSAKKTIKIAVK